MRLINVSTLELEEYIGDHVPEYAILSHVWGTQEVTLQDWMDRAKAVEMAGYAKIRSTCLQATKDGIEYAWVDTICIDKTSSAELSEAINSMFDWYRNSKVCYAYLADVDTPLQGDSSMATFSSSRWFSRGWTLQELLASENVVFFNKDWTVLGTKQELCEHVSATTGIHRAYLVSSEAIFTASTARRMSWLSNRATSRAEDLAYCMLGIFNINLALLYGEGHRAFLRLQEEIIKVSDDQSIFCWSYGSPEVPSSWWNILAPHPSAFRDSGDYVPRPQEGLLMTYGITNAGLSITLPTLYTCSGICAILDVGWGDNNNVRQASKSTISRNPPPGPLQRLGIHLSCADKAGRRNRIGYPRGPVSINATLFAERKQLYLRCRGILKDFIPENPSMMLSKAEEEGLFEFISRPGDSLFLTFNCELKFRWALTHNGIAGARFHKYASSLKLPPPHETRRAGIYIGFEIPKTVFRDFILFIAGIREEQTGNEGDDQGGTKISKTRWYVESSPQKRKAYERDAKTRQGKIAYELDRIERTAPLEAYSSTYIDHNVVHAILHGPSYSTAYTGPQPIANGITTTTTTTAMETPIHISVVDKCSPRKPVDMLYGGKEVWAEIPKLLYAPRANYSVIGGPLTCPDWSHCELMREKFKLTKLNQ